jgi:hemolysin activation/secretion protein
MPLSSILIRGGAPLLLLLGLAGSLTAQTYEQLAPKTPAPLPARADAAPVEAPAPESDRVIVPALHGLVFLTDPDALQPAGVTSTGLQVANLALLETAEFRGLVTPFLGQPLSLGALNRLTRDVVLYFRRHGRPVVDVLVPEQAASSGTVQILVIEGRLGEVRVEGNRWFTADQLVSVIRARPGEVIEGAPLLADLVWLNQNPFRQVDLVYARGTQPGETDLVLRTRDRLPMRLYTGYEDSGNALTGYDRVLAGLNWGNAFGRDEQFNYQLSASPDFRKLVAHSASYLMPLPRLRHTLTVFGSHARSRPELAGGLFALTGHAWQVSARYRVPLPTSSNGTWARAFTAGLDFKRSNNNLSFGGTAVFAQETDIVQATAAISASNTDRRGMTSGELTLALSPGGLTDGNRTSAYQSARTLARPDYAYARLELERRTRLPAGLTWHTRMTAQFASTNLLGSEQLGLGGAHTLRGYEEREANGDHGLMLSNELHVAPLLMAPAPGRAWSAGRLDPFVFVDYGLVASHQRLPGEASRLELASAGLGLRFNLGTVCSVRADYGWQLKDSGVSDGRRNHRGHVSIVLSH